MFDHPSVHTVPGLACAHLGAPHEASHLSDLKVPPGGGPWSLWRQCIQSARGGSEQSLRVVPQTCFESLLDRLRLAIVPSSNKLIPTLVWTSIVRAICETNDGNV